jgi:dienelactone hydrolase
VRRALAVALLLACALVLAGCGGSSTPTPPPKLPASLAQRYEYSTAAASPLHDRGVLNQGYPVKVHDVWYTGPDGDRVPGYLAVPPGKGPFAGVVFVPGAGTSREEWLVPAVELAARGAVTLALSTQFIEGQNSSSGLAGIISFRAGFTQSVLDIRRALDLLAARRDVDPKRLGLLGHSLGGMVSGVVAGVYPHVAAAVLVAPAQHAHFNPPLQADAQQQAGSLLRATDPTRYLPYSRAAILLALGRHDQVIPRAEYDAFRAAVPDGSTVRWYDTGHGMSPAAVEDMLAWFADELDLGPVPAYARRVGG